jgi:putative phosphoribosyl transferase
MNSIFADRQEAGRALAKVLSERGDLADVVVLALPRGGLPVALEITRALRAPLDVMVVRKLGLPQQPELAMGAVASGGVRVLNDEVLRAAGVSRAVVEEVARKELAELTRRERVYRGDRQPVELTGRTVVLVDDGIATGSTLQAAIRAVRSRGAARIIVAAPVAPPETVHRLSAEADEVVCLVMPDRFVAISPWYRHFPQLEDREVHAILEASRVASANEG